ncbi:RNA polymerase sigma factor (sigma-70 family) [Tumebacillus sp. BK434]|uniref:RNA polymerase sigma factor n=1 Tax=Tumebacillus sp. BK434 TaxID=2512169 RepID=UPI001051378D|nr:sigma-70 family RNA polymerase sigma factor [Tumebacillus sp. BK434]TCP57877.1 RNA polymerase sigma factor (sigma-70 family) [Tumebacillus sp. BK434]
MSLDVNSAYQRLFEDLGGQKTGQATHFQHRDVVSRYVAPIIAKKARRIGLQLNDNDVEDLVAQVHLRISTDCSSYDQEFSLKSWLTNRIVRSVVFKEKQRRDREQENFPRVQPSTGHDADVSEGKKNEVWDWDSHKFLGTCNPVEREVLSGISVDDIWNLCADNVSENQLNAAICRIQRNMSSEEIAEVMGKTDKQVDDLIYQFRRKMIPLLEELGYSKTS